jgi:hypothetical protein
MGMQIKTGLPGVTRADAANEFVRRQNWPILYDDTCQFIHRELSDLLSVWRSLAGQWDVPWRRDMTARLLQPCLRRLALYERVTGADGSRRYRVRLMGTAIVHMLGELTGRFLDEALPEKFVPRWYPMLDVPLATGAPLRILARVDTVNKSFIVGENISAPLRAEDGETKIVLVATFYDSTRPWTDVAAEECKRLGLEPPCIA